MMIRTSLILIGAALIVGGCENADHSASTTPTKSPTPTSAQPQTQTVAARDQSGPPTTPAAPAASAPPAAPANLPAAPAHAVNPAEPPHITFESTDHYFGAISEAQPVSASFKFTNTGGQKLVIEKVKTSCGCTTANLSKMEYEPGESGSIDITFTPAGPKDGELKLINVFSNAQPQPEGFTRLVIHADVQPFIVIEPRILEAGIMKYHEAHRFAITVSCPNDPNFVIRSLVATNAAVKMHERPPVPNQTGKIIDVMVLPEAPWGALFSWLQVTASAAPAPGADQITHTSQVRLQGQVFGDLRAEPDTFRFGAKPGEQFSRTVELRRDSGQPYDLLSATIKDFVIPGATVNVQKIAPNKYALTINVTADVLRPLALGNILVKTNVPGEEEIQIPIVGVVRTEDPSVH